MIDYDAELQLHNERLRRAYRFTRTDRILDIGCGTGQTTRQAALLAPDGMAVGVDSNEAMVARAKAMAATEGIPNVHFEVADVERHSFRAGDFDAAVSRFGTMFFADPQTAFSNIARAIRPGGHLMMMVWQSHELNEWAVALDGALGVERIGRPVQPDVPEGSSLQRRRRLYPLDCSGKGRFKPIADDGTDPFSLGEPAKIRHLLAASGFESVTLADVAVPVFYGRDVDRALEFVTQFSAVSQTLQEAGERASSVIARLRSTLASHSSERGVWFGSRAWIVRAVRL